MEDIVTIYLENDSVLIVPMPYDFDEDDLIDVLEQKGVNLAAVKYAENSGGRQFF